MNCQSVISSMGFVCREVGGDALRVWSPFTYGHDGERIGLYVEKAGSGYRVTDNCEALMHASYMGINLTQGRMNAIRKAAGVGAQVSEGGEITANVSEEMLGSGVAAVLNATMAVSHFETQWQPRWHQESFTKSVETVLEAVLGEMVLKNVTVTGASGHQLELPLAVRSGRVLTYVQPISATDEKKVDWNNVYAGWGRMTDIKNANLEDVARLVVLEEAANDPEMKRAVVLLSDSAAVVNFSKLPQWAAQRRA